MTRENQPYVSESSYSINYSHDEAPEKGGDIPYSTDTVKDYLRAIGRVPLLNAEEEIELAKRIESGLMAERIMSVRESDDREGDLALIHEQIVTAAEKKLGGRTNERNKADDEAVEADTQKPKHKRPASKGKSKEELTQAQRAAAKREADAGVAIIAKYADGESVTTEELQALADSGVEAKRHMVAANLRLVVNVAKNYARLNMPFIEIIQEGNIGLNRAVEKFDYTKGYKFSTYSTWWIRQSITRGIADQSRTIRLPNYLHEDLRKIEKKRRELTTELNREPTDEEIAREMSMSVVKLREWRHYAQEPMSIHKLIGESGGRGQTDTELIDILVSNDEPSVADNVWNMEMKRGVQSMLATLDERTALVFKLRHGVDCERPHTLDEIAQIIGVTRERVRQIEKKTADMLRKSAIADDMRDLLRDA